MNRSIRATAVFTMLLILILVANLTRVQVFSEDRYAHNALNKRQYHEMQSIPRGQIATGGLVLARSVKDEQGYYRREYVTDPVVYGPVEGYLSNVYGAAGLELGYNDILNGTDGSLFASRWMDTLLGRTQAGASLELTLNPEAQQAAYSGLADRGYEGAVVAIRPSTGEILAMASTPSFSPASLTDPATAESTWSELTSDPGAPLLNHATQDALPPGSTFKVITTAAGLAGDVTPETRLTAASRTTLPGTETTLENYGGQTCGQDETASLTTAFALSCNTAFVELGVKVGADALRDQAEKFGVTDSYDLGLPSIPGKVGDLPDPAAVGQSSIGQRDVAMTVLENAVVAATVANGGKRMNPYLVSRILGSDLRTLRSTDPRELNRPVSPEVAAQLTEMMRASERNTAGYTGADIASKTGTAEHGEDSRNSNPHAWYIAFGPSENADVAVAVLVKNGGDRGQAATGGSVAAPIGRAVIDAVLRSGR
ncbi:peptidoglycan D,D-transpeptidase FtsI family protein [Corynebacterium pygosceleis]|uniref:Penicillin-binding protein 2 n=1 Tax=Corynebacterium pygosceleis TaxID=2800406 RepID=A0A9Q4GII1_9CORY|nr:penicillin-binding protein 2 [Corynebacterium pygosceleis]MCK7637234.1 penicillin-binding protein 2 [Corynebacterium pygosceleis]MCK7676171.1 penicillin-binding protein 2 [Corynebacterium pygosceleis]MCL0119991.1 penicillin-binding protein 2 [Corynebacterium pygosceleis]MCX7445137.1 penicillin-binding protein 2 [Corynebacterium pygosceleis]MCX7468438.1 penicillin-binding protein 2 [Corynebacterium pygosceleis]